jgi:dTDP-4-dehydrorhamnose 3,5-epimerase
LPGVYLIEPEPACDERGFFARIFCPHEFAEAGITFSPVHINLSRNHHRHTLRGMHYQHPPFAEAKLVRVTSGALFDVVLDLRRDSPTYREWIGVELDATGGSAIFIPEGCAHGFLTLADNADVLYMMSRAHVAGQARGVRFDDPAFAIAWPVPPSVISEADRNWPDWPAGQSASPATKGDAGLPS